MMLSPLMIKTVMANLQLSIRDADHFKQLMDGLCSAIKEKHLDGSFDCFAFAWSILPQWAKVLLLSIAYREDRKAFEGITPLTPIDFFNEQQRAILSTACDKLLTAVVTLMADYDFTEDFYKGWLDARRTHLQNNQLEKTA